MVYVIAEKQQAVDKQRPQTVAELLESVGRLVGDADCKYIFRGEPKQYPKVSSSLYRECEKVAKQIGSVIDIDAIEREITNDVSRFGEKDKDAVLEQLQHYGGKTNQIDFSTDYLIALFFACEKRFDEDGRLILLDKRVYHKHTHTPTRPQSRVVAQKSKFLRPPAGYIDIESAKGVEVVVVPRELKQNLRNYLEKHHDINANTIYNDIHGYINQAKVHEETYIHYYHIRIRTEDIKGEREELKPEYIEWVTQNLDPMSGFAISEGIDGK